MIIEIHNREEAEDEALGKALLRTLHHQHVQSVDISVHPRVPADAPEYKNPGWLEYGINFRYTTGGGMFVMMIQRKIGADYEFHS